jgi:hypothetical protein
MMELIGILYWEPAGIIMFRVWDLDMIRMRDGHYQIQLVYKESLKDIVLLIIKTWERL